MNGFLSDIANRPRGAMLVALYRLAHWASYKRKQKRFHTLWAAPTIIAYRVFCELIWGYEIPAATRIGRNLRIDHGFGIVINKHAIIGDNCRIKHNVTIGCQTLPDGSQGPSPRLGNNIDIGAGAIILGGITIGDNVLIAAGAIVTRDIPSNSVVRSLPSDVYRRKADT